MQEGNSLPFDSTIFLTHVQSLCNLLDVARFKDIVAGLGKQAVRDQEILTSSHDELNTLRPAVQRSRELETLLNSKEDSFKIAIVLLMNAPQHSRKQTSETSTALELLGLDTGVKVGTGDLDLSSYPLWKVIREVLKQLSEIRVYELEEHLQVFGVKAARSAIESALATHRREFKITKRGREKYVALKGA